MTDPGAGLVLFTRDLRVHDNPALVEAIRRHHRVVPLFVVDPAITKGRFSSANRNSFLLDSLVDLRASLTQRGGSLFVRLGDVVAETMAIATKARVSSVYVAEDYSGYAVARLSRLGRACAEVGIELVVTPGIIVVPPDRVLTGTGDHFKVFSPFARRWATVPRRKVLGAPHAVSVPSRLSVGVLPELSDLVRSLEVSPNLAGGGEREGRRRMHRWLRGYRDDPSLELLASDATTRLSPYLHLGCISPLELEGKARSSRADHVVRQLCWRDFFAQVNLSQPALTSTDQKPRGDRWRRAPSELEAWKKGLTGYPIVDAGMRQMLDEGWMHNRARLIAASLLVKDLYIDWREGAAHFFRWLVDGDVANNAGNWQWVAGTGNDTRPNRVFNPTRQAERFDPNGDYVRRYVPELAHIQGKHVHRPWELDRSERNGYPLPIVDHSEAVERFRANRTRASAPKKTAE